MSNGTSNDFSSDRVDTSSFKLMEPDGAQISNNSPMGVFNYENITDGIAHLLFIMTGPKACLKKFQNLSLKHLYPVMLETAKAQTPAAVCDILCGSFFGGGGVGGRENQFSVKITEVML